MNMLVQGILDNDSFFGRLMTKAGIIIGANLMFVIFSIPVITIGPALAALYYVMLETLHGDGVLNPFKTFWKGFRDNLKQGTIVWIAVMLLSVLGYVDVRFCEAAGGVMTVFRYGVYVIGAAVLVIFLYLLPVMAAFSDTIPHLIRNAVFFACRRPFILPVMLFFDVFPLYLSYTDAQYQPLYAFLWCFFGFGAIAMIGSSLLYPDFRKFLEPEEDWDCCISPEDEKKMLADMKKLDGV